MSFSLHNNSLQAWRTKGMGCSPPLPSSPTYCLLYPSACSFHIMLIKEVPDQLHEEKWGGLPWASGAIIMCRPTMGPVFFQPMIKYLAHKYRYYIIPKLSQQIVTIWETLCLGRFESSKVSLRSKIGFSSRVGESNSSDLILCLSSCPWPPSLRLTAWCKGLWGYVSRPRTGVFAWALAVSCAASLEIISSLVWWAMIAGRGPAGCHLTERPNFNRCSVHPVIHILVDCGSFSARVVCSWHCVSLPHLGVKPCQGYSI